MVLWSGIVRFATAAHLEQLMNDWLALRIEWEKHQWTRVFLRRTCTANGLCFIYV